MPKGSTATAALTHYDVLVVGAGHGGAQVAISLRQRKFEGSIGIISEEHDPPYERPPLSKEYLSGEKAFERILIRPVSFWAERGIDLLLGRRVIAVDAEGRRVTMDCGRVATYEQLVWATGGKPRRLSCDGHDLGGVHAIRTKSDVDRMMVEVPSVGRVIVVGGGYIGLEAAAVLTKLGKKVIVLEAQDRVLARVAGEFLSRFYEEQHRSHGVDVRLGVQVACLEGVDNSVTGVRLADGDLLPCDLVVVGVGIIPEVDPLLRAGAIGSNGVEVDPYCRTSLPSVFAIGDCAAHANRFADGATIRVESVANANDQAVTVAKFITGDLEEYATVPWFWSNQYDLKLQTVGLSTGYDKAVLRGDPSTRSFSLVYLRNQRVIALDCVNATRDYVQGKALVLRGAEIDANALADTARPLKELLG